MKSLGGATGYITLEYQLGGEIKNAGYMEEQNNEEIKDLSCKDSCSHWGLTHWISGITEYIFDRCLGGCFSAREGFNELNPDRAYVITAGNGVYVSSDCFCVSCCALYCYDKENDFYITPNGMILGFLCCPLAATIHTCCCIHALCMPTLSPLTLDNTENHAKFILKEQIKVIETENNRRRCEEEYLKLNQSQDPMQEWVKKYQQDTYARVEGMRMHTWQVQQGNIRRSGHI